MQTELFKKKAILLFYDEMQSILYSDILSMNGFETTVVRSVSELMDTVSDEQHILLLDADFSQERNVQKLLGTIRNKFENLSVIGLSIYSKEEKNIISELFDKFITKPSPLSVIIDAIFSCTYIVGNDNFAVQREQCALTY